MPKPDIGPHPIEVAAASGFGRPFSKPKPSKDHFNSGDLQLTCNLTSDGRNQNREREPRAVRPPADQQFGRLSRAEPVRFERLPRAERRDQLGTKHETRPATPA